MLLKVWYYSVMHLWSESVNLRSIFRWRHVAAEHCPWCAICSLRSVNLQFCFVFFFKTIKLDLNPNCHESDIGKLKCLSFCCLLIGLNKAVLQRSEFKSNDTGIRNCLTHAALCVWYLSFPALSSVQKLSCATLFTTSWFQDCDNHLFKGTDWHFDD